MRLGSAGISDEEFLAAIEDCRYPDGAFHHADHLRMGWILLATMPLNLALHRAAANIRRFAQHNGKADLYHETITRAWMLLLASHDEANFEEFFEQNREQLSPTLLYKYWNQDTLTSAKARAEWVEPDIRPLPH